MIRNFPYTNKIIEPRAVQVDCLNWIESKWGDFNRFAVCAPVGSGKSAIGLAVLRSFNHGLYTSPLNALVDQVDEGFVDYVTTLKGRKHYPCLAGKEHCGVGYCQKNGLCQIDSGDRVCTSKDLPLKCENCGCKDCVYRSAFYAFQGSKLGNTNFSLFLLGVTNSPSVIVIDEADQIEDFVRLHYTYSFNKKLSLEWKKTLNGLSKHRDTLITTMGVLGQRLFKEKLKKDPEKFVINNLSGEITGLEREIEHVTQILLDYDEYGEEWVVEFNQNKTIIRPVTVDRFIEPLLKNKKVVLMSATLSPSLRNQGYAYVEVPSPFPPKLRPWRFIPIGNMGFKYRAKTIPLVVQHLSKLPTGKTIVHCNSYKIAEALGLGLEKNHDIYPMVQTNGVQTQYKRGVKRNEAIQLFKDSQNPREILLSVNLTRGVDLFESNITNNIIVVLPFPNPTDPLVKKKNKLLGKAWQGKDMAHEIQQSYGRINRNDRKTTNTEILDSRWRWWYPENKKYFNEWFTECRVKP